jgi:hypothetical protein
MPYPAHHPHGSWSKGGKLFQIKLKYQFINEPNNSKGLNKFPLFPEQQRYHPA